MIPTAYLPRYREFHPPSALAALIEAIWEFSLPERDDAEGSTFPDRILPDGCVEVICRIDRQDDTDPATIGGPFVRGPLARFDFAPIPYGSRYVGVRIKPGMAAALFGVRPRELLDRRVSLGDLLPNRAHRFERVGQARTIGEACKLLMAAVAHSREFSNVHDESALTTRVVATIRRHRGRLSLAALAHQLGCSERTLHRRVTAAVGLSPKEFSRIVRFRHAAELIVRDPRRPLSAIALDAGYADQSHMSRDFAVLAGLSPASLRKSACSDLSDSSKTRRGDAAIVSGWAGVTGLATVARSRTEESAGRRVGRRKCAKR